MANRVQHLRHTVTALANFTGLSAEVTVNLANNTVVVHDGITPGGHEQALSSLLNVNSATTSVPGKMTDQHVRDLILALANSISNAADIADNTNSILLNITAITSNAAAIAQNASDISALSGGQGAYLLLSGGQMSGSLLLAADPVSNTEPSTKSYTDTGDAAAEANAISHANGLAATLQASKANRAGDTFSGPVLLSADPIVPMQAATKQYVDASITDVIEETITPGSILHAYGASSGYQNTASGLRPLCTAYFSVPGRYSIRAAMQRHPDSGDNFSSFEIHVYKNGAPTGQIYTRTDMPTSLAGSSFNFDMADSFDKDDTLSLSLSIQGLNFFRILNLGLFAAQQPVPVSLISASTLTTAFGI